MTPSRPALQDPAPFCGILPRVSELLERAHLWLGRLLSALIVLMVAIGAGNAVARYVGRWVGMNLSSNAWLEAQWYLFSLVFLLGAAYTLHRGAHVRVDVLYGRLPSRARGWITSKPDYWRTRPCR